MKSRLAVITGLLSGVMLILATAPAMAHADVSVSIGVPGFYEQPAPVYVQPRPYYVEPRPYYVQPQPYYVEQPYRQDWRQRRWNRDHRPWQDRDHDGVPNRYDHDRDGDGIPNRFDRRPNNPYRN